MRAKTTEYLILIYMIITECYEVYEGYIEFNSTQKAQEDKKLVFQKNR